MSNDLRFKWFGCQMIWDSIDLVVNWFGIQASRRFPFLRDFLKNDTLKLKNEAFLRDFLKKWSFEAPKTKLLCETSFKKWSFEAQKRSFCARLPSKFPFWNSKTKHFYETSFKNQTLETKNAAFLRDFLQKWHVDQTRALRVTIRFSDFEMDASKVLCLQCKSWAKAYELL